MVKRRLSAARRVLEDGSREIEARIRAAELLSLGSFRADGPLLMTLLQPRQPDRVQIAAVRSLESFDSREATGRLIDAWSRLTPTVRAAVVESLVSRSAGRSLFLDALETGRIDKGDLTAGRLQSLLTTTKGDERKRIEKLIDAASHSLRGDVVERYRRALSMPGNVAEGRRIFRRVCAACHRLEDHGHELAPNLATLRNRGREFVLLNVFDPNREVNPQYLNYIAVTSDGKSHTGMIASETATTIQLVQAENKRETLLRADLEEFASSGISLMPENLEKEINVQCTGRPAGVPVVAALIRDATCQNSCSGRVRRSSIVECMTRPPSTEIAETAMARAKELARGLYPHQVEGVAFLLARRRAILADDMGLGKTRQSIVAMVEAEPDGPWLVVCPASVKRNWAREIHLALGGVRDVAVVDQRTSVPHRDFRGWVVINYDIVRKHEESLGRLPFAGFTFDEAHYLKNHRAQRTRAACRLLDDAATPVVHCLTGTPMMNRPRDLFPLLQLVGHSLGQSFLGYAKRYCDAHKGDFGWVTKGASNLEELAVQLHGTMLRRTKDEVLDLPGKVRNWLTVDIPESTARRGMRRVLATLMKETSGQSGDEEGNRLPPISRAKLIARLTPVRTNVAGAKMKHTIEFAKGIIDQGEKVIVYTCFREVGEAIADEFPSEQVRFMSGATSADARQQIVDDFQTNDDVRVLCATVIAGGVGITLTAARTVIFNDLDWVPANHWQAEDRAYRIGQKHPVNVYYFKAANSIDEFVGQVLETKSNMISAVVDGEALWEQTSGDVFADFERAIHGLDLQTSRKITDEQLDVALTQAVAVYSETSESIGPSAGDHLHKPKKPDLATIRALARALSPPLPATRYRISGSRDGQFHELEVDGTDVVCSCRGFEFRGQCKHARTLKEALANDQVVPDAYERMK